MSVFRRLLSGTYRRGRIAEARGFYRDAAALYAAAGAEGDAARALAHAAERCESVDEAVATYRDALRWTKSGAPLRRDLLAKFGARVLGRAKVEGARTEAERRLVGEAAEALAEAERFLAAAEAWDLLGEWEKTAECLERGGEIERLEALLAAKGKESDARRAEGLALDAYRAALETGARAEALRQLGIARANAPHDPSLGALERDLVGRRPKDGAVRVRIGRDRELVCVGALPIELGREGRFPLRGASLSRSHARLDRAGDDVRVEDLGSRNGTRIGGMSIDPSGAPLTVAMPVSLGLGDDVGIHVAALGARGLALRVDAGLDRGLGALVSPDPIELPGTPFRISFPGAWATVHATRERPAVLEGRSCAAPIEVLAGDVIQMDGAILEVLG